MRIKIGLPRYRQLLVAVLCIAPVLLANAADQEPSLRTYGPVRAGETLYGIAAQLRLEFPSATTSQMAYALLRANPNIFKGDINGLKSGTVLKVPNRDFIKAVSARESKQYVLGGKLPPLSGSPPTAVAQAAAPAPLTAVKAEADASAIAAIMAPVIAAEAAPASLSAPPAAGIALPQDPVAAGTARPSAPSRDATVLQYAFKDDPRGRELLAQSNSLPADQLYARLLPLESDYAGDVDYDYLLGSAALDSGNASPAVFALQRAVATAPNYAGARLELARAYFAIGDNESARREFETLRQEKPPPKIETAINEYLDAINRRSAEYRPQRSAFAEISGGYDSNANGATDTSTFLGFVLDSRNVAQDSAYSGISLGGQWSAPLRAGLRTIGELTSLYKAYPDAPFVDTTVGRLSSGLEARLGLFTLALQGSGQILLLDDRENSRNVAVDMSASLPLGDLWRAGLSLRQGWQRYADALKAQDVNQTYAGLYTAGQFENLPRAQFLLALTAGRDTEQKPGSPFGRDVFGLRVNASADLWNAATLLFSVAGVKSDYEGSFSPGGPVRADRQKSASLGLDWRRLPGKGWTLHGQVTATRQTSNLSLYEYDRVDAGVSVRKEIK